MNMKEKLIFGDDAILLDKDVQLVALCADERVSRPVDLLHNQSLISNKNMTTGQTQIQQDTDSNKLVAESS
jgi:hypothetical protein